MKRVEIDYGEGTLPVDLPDGATVFVPDGSQEPAPIEDPAGEVRNKLSQPRDVPPLRELVGRGSKVAIAFPDEVKGGTHDQAHRMVTLPVLIEELTAAGVAIEDIRLVCAVGLHRKNTREEMSNYLPESIMQQFGPSQLVNHDAEDPDGIVDLGKSEFGDRLQFNRICAEADLCIVLGHAQGNPYGGFSGGHKTFTTGLTTWRSIAGHHVPSTMHRPDFVPITTESHFRKQLSAIGHGIQDALGTRFFVIDAIVGHGSRILGIEAGDVDAVEEHSWPLARERTNVELDMEPADILVVGLPRDFHYGSGMGTNPILVSQAISAVVARAAGAFREGGVVIAAAVCDGWFNEERFPSYEETFERYGEVVTVADMEESAEDLSTRPEYVEAYRHRFAYHPFHALSMLSMAEIARARCSRILVPGAKSPFHARAMGLEPTKSVEDALSTAKRYVGSDAHVLALPEFLKHVPPHLFAGSATT